MKPNTQNSMIFALVCLSVACSSGGSAKRDDGAGGDGGEQASAGSTGQEGGNGGSSNGGQPADASVANGGASGGTGGTSSTGGSAPRDASPPDASNDPRDKRWVFLLIGQSNMGGQALCEAQDIVVPARVFKLTLNKTWVPAHEPTNLLPFLDANGAPCNIGAPFMGPGRAFGVELVQMVKDPQVEIYIINAAVRGSAIETWDPKGGHENFTKMVSYLGEGMKKGMLKGVIWHQGESNRGTSRTDYVNKLGPLIADLRQRAQRSDLPFVAGEIGATGQANNVNLALRDLAVKDMHFAVASSMGLKLQEDQVHYDSASQRQYGKRYAEAWFKLSGL